MWHQGLLIYHVKVNFFICRHLDSNIALDVVNEAPSWNYLILPPFSRLRIFIIFKLEEEDI